MGNDKFQQKLWKALNECRTGAIKWSNRGDSIIINFQKFKREYLDMSGVFCKSNNLSSFVRQLNLYGFKKLIDLTRASATTEVEKEYSNPNFLRSRPDLLKYVTRNHTSPKSLLNMNRSIKQEIISDSENEIPKKSVKKQRQKKKSRKHKKTSLKTKKESHLLNGFLKESEAMDFIPNKENSSDYKKKVHNFSSATESRLNFEEVFQKNVSLNDITNKPKNYFKDSKVKDESNVYYKDEPEIKLNMNLKDDLYIGQKDELKIDLKDESNMSSCFDNKNPKTHIDDMYQIAQKMGINVSERLKKLTEIKEKSCACATFKYFKPSLELLTMDYESEYDKIFIDAESPHMLLTYSVLYSGKYR